MMCKRPVLALIVAAAVSSSGYGVALCAPDPCCRDLATPVWYRHFDHHAVEPGDSTVVKVDAVGTEVLLTIRARSPIQDPFFSAPHSDFTTKDGGRTWTGRPVMLPSPLSRLHSEYVEAPSDPKFLYRYVKDIGLYLRSEDRGKTWQLPHYSVGGVSREEFAFSIARSRFHLVLFELAAIHPRDPSTLYATISVFPWSGHLLIVPPDVKWRDPSSNFPSGFLSSHELPGMYVSHDGGETWAESTDVLRNSSPLGFSSSNPNLMFGHGLSGIVKSTDGGKTWEAVGQQKELEARPKMLTEKETGMRSWGAPAGLSVLQFVIDPTDDKIVYIVSNKGVYRTLDGGNTWCLLDLGFDVIDSYNSLALNPDDPTELFVGTRYGTFHSTDRGSSFRRIYPPPSETEQGGATLKRTRDPTH